MRAYSYAALLMTAVMTALLWPGSHAFAGDEFRLLQKDGNHVKWGDPAIGAGARVTYAYVTAPLEFPATVNCSSMTPLDGLLATSGISASVLRQEVAAAFAAWEAAADISFLETDDPTAAQIVIGAQSTPRWFAFANVESSVAEKGSIGTINRALICLNPRIKWKVGFDGDLTVYDLRYTFIHEIGHAIGLDHAGASSGQLMSFAYRETFRELQAGDISGVDALYGRRSGRINVASGAVPSPVPVGQLPQTAVRP